MRIPEFWFRKGIVRRRLLGHREIVHQQGTPTYHAQKKRQGSSVSLAISLTGWPYRSATIS